MKINYLAIVILAVIAMVTNAVWYGIFAEPWMSLNGLTMDQIESTTGVMTWLPYVVALVNGLVLYYVMALLFKELNVVSLQRGIIYAAIFFFGFLFLEATTKNMFSYRPFSLTLIDEGVTLINYLIGGAVLGAWRKE